MIKSYRYLDQHYALIDQTNRIGNNNNRFTIVVGKNGTGKSRLLSGIIRELLRSRVVKKTYISEEFRFDYRGSLLELNEAPDQIIAVSTSPFDRFPVHKLKRGEYGYSYLGIRDVLSQNVGLAYLSKITASLIEVINLRPKQLNGIMKVLKVLGYGDLIEIKVSMKIQRPQLERMILTSESQQSALEKMLYDRSYPSIQLNRRFFENQDGTISKKKTIIANKILGDIYRDPELRFGFPIFQIDGNGMRPHYKFGENFESLTFMLRSGIARVQDVTLFKQATSQMHSITDASSGEQSVVVSMLGIASRITDNSLICIDEPEVCLHPEWQEKYMNILTKTFSLYKGCHFIIATHSPQVVANLRSTNCYILSMETGELINARHVIKHSADFQLANVFDAPGYGNEYLTRIAMNVFSKVAKRKVFDADDKITLDQLNLHKDQLKQDDPVLQLTEAINEMFEIYGRD